jgi:OOP family OmpA-OmpF porin
MPGRKTLTATVLGAALLLGHVAAQAAEEVGQAYLKGLGTFISPDDDRNVDSGFAGGLGGFGYALSEHFNVELDFQSLNLDGDDGAEGGGSFPDQDQTALSVNLMNLYNRDGLFAPYILAGLGVVSTEIDGSDDDDFQAEFGVGVLTRLWGSRLSLRSEVLGRYQDADEDSLTDALVNVGFSVALGSKAAPVAVAAPVVAAAAPPPPPPPPADSDGDGVIDPNDQCPETPKGDRVGPQGCSCDVTRQVQFKLNSAELTDADKTVLDEVAANLTRLKFVSGTVVGHTDSSGTEAFNQKLSERRAESVATYLQGKGIAVGRLAASGAGESEPIADNKTAEGRALNRRVVLKRTDCDAPR